MFPSITSMEIQPSFVEYEPETESESLFSRASASRQSQFNEAVNAAIEVAAQVDPYKTIVPEGVVIPTLDAVNWSGNVDIRPRLVEKSGVERLIDSGAQISATVRLPSDRPDQNVSLVAVNGSKIKTYGVRVINVKIGRKMYSIEAVICDIKQDILGMDFLHKYKLSLEWDDETHTRLFIKDKRADIKKELQIVTVPRNLLRTHHMEPGGECPRSRSNEAIAFEVACVKELGQEDVPQQKLSQSESLIEIT